MELPDFNTMAASHTTMAAHLDNISHEHASMAAQLGRMANIPAFDAGEQILDAIARLSRRIDERFDENTRRFDSMYRKHSFCIDITSNFDRLGSSTRWHATLIPAPRIPQPF